MVTASTLGRAQAGFGCYLPSPEAPIARAYGMIVLGLDGDQICAMTWSCGTGIVPHFGLPRTLPG